MNIKVAQVIGLNTDQKAAQVISSSSDGETHFFAVLLLASDDAFTKGRQALSELSDFYFDSEATSVGEKLKATFTEAQKKFEGEQLDILLASISSKVLYLIFKGSVASYLKRGQDLSPLLSVGASDQLISGFLQEGDRILFATQSLITLLGDSLEKSLNLPLPSFEQEITDRIGTSNLENQLLAALLVNIEQTEVELPSLQPDTNSDTAAAPRIHPFTIVKKLLALKRFIPKSGRTRLIIAAILIVIIALGIGYNIKAKKAAKLEADFNQALKGAKEDFEAAKGMATLNPQEAKLKLTLAKQKTDQALSLKPKDSKALDFKKQIEQQEGSILQQSSVSEFNEFFDMDLVKKNFRSNHMSLSSGKLVLLDEGAKTLVLVDIVKKSNQILAGSEQLGEATFSSLNGGLAFVYSKDKGVLKVDTASQKTTSIAKIDSDWGQIDDIYGFAGNIYLLDSGKNMIWKYLPTSQGYSDKREYLNKNIKADFALSIRMQIESSIYILKKDGEMLRFTRGDKDSFSYEGLDKGVKEPKSFFVSSDTDNLYLLDSGNSRLLILSKTGVYKGQISGDKFSQASDLSVDEKDKKVYLLDGGKIYIVDLK